MDFRPKDIAFGFVVLCPEHDIGKIKTTYNSIDRRYNGRVPCVCAVGKNTSPKEVKEIGEVCPCVKGGMTVTSLINAGIKKGHKGWNMTVMEGAVVPAGLDVLYSKYIERDEDVLYPVLLDKDVQGKPVAMYLSFIDTTLNGLCVHQDFFKKVGDFGDNTLEVEKLLWALTAMGKGCRFKGLANVRIL